ncbi:hypothetical protein [Polaribacter sp. Asnod1-A03]|uniref:hypothetical protein n=1 Tax=Polaribacter sp. Asnod1-A03 TaxID=3160581 RepID=UPI003869087B
MVIFLLPLFVLSAHAFSNHEHRVCISKVENHIHKKDIDCQLDLYKTNNSLLIENTFNLKLKTPIYSYHRPQYNFLKNHYHLSFSLRGPPVCI